MTMVGSALGAGAARRISASTAQKSLFDTICLYGWAYVKHHMLWLSEKRAKSWFNETEVNLKLLYSFIKYLKWSKW